MRLFSAFATAAFLAATPCMAQVVIHTDGNDAARHEQRADQQANAARHDDYKAHEDAKMGDHREANRERAEAQRHEAMAEHHEHRADQDSRGGVHVDIGR